MNRDRTRLMALHRLIPRMRAGHDSMWSAYTEYATEDIADKDAVVQGVHGAEAFAIWIGVQGVSGRADWCGDASTTTGLDVPLSDCRSGGVLLFGAGDTAYAMSYGAGYTLIPDGLKDRCFGISFVVSRRYEMLQRRAEEADHHPDVHLNCAPTPRRVSFCSERRHKAVRESVGSSQGPTGTSAADLDSTPDNPLRFGVERVG